LITIHGVCAGGIRADLLTRLAKEKEQYAMLARNALVLRSHDARARVAQRIYIEGAAQMAAAPEFNDQVQLRDVLAAMKRAQDHRASGELYRTPGNHGARTDWRQGDGQRGRAFGVDQRAISFQDQSQGPWACLSDAHAV